MSQVVEIKGKELEEVLELMKRQKRLSINTIILILINLIGILPMLFYRFFVGDVPAKTAFFGLLVAVISLVGLFYLIKQWLEVRYDEGQIRKRGRPVQQGVDSPTTDNNGDTELGGEEQPSSLQGTSQLDEIRRD